MKLKIIVTAFILSVALPSYAKKCEGKDLAKQLMELSGYDSLHNCSVNVRTFTKAVRDGNEQVLLRQFQVEVQDDYHCGLYPESCEAILFEFQIADNCLGEVDKTKGFVFKKVYDLGSYKILKKVIGERDFFGNLVNFEVHEVSSNRLKSKKIFCRPELFGENR